MDDHKYRNPFLNLALVVAGVKKFRVVFYWCSLQVFLVRDSPDCEEGRSVTILYTGYLRAHGRHAEQIWWPLSSSAELRLLAHQQVGRSGSRNQFGRRAWPRPIPMNTGRKT